MNNATRIPEEADALHIAPPQLSRTSLAICLLILLGIFAFLNPIWEAREMSAWNENIWWSYIPIPFLVLIFLRIEGKLAFSALVLDSMKLTFIKFVITIVAANLLWEYWGTPGTGEPLSSLAIETGEPTFEPREAPLPTAPDRTRIANVSGVIVDQADNPIPNALVWIAAGLEQHIYPPPIEPLQLKNAGDGYRPVSSVVQTWQRLELSSGDRALHTAVMTNAAGERLFNYPVLPDGERALMFRRSRGLTRLTCSVHGESEYPAELVVTDNPFHASSDAEGYFSFEDVPAVDLLLRVLASDGRKQEGRLQLSPGETSSIRIALD